MTKNDISRIRIAIDKFHNNSYNLSKRFFVYTYCRARVSVACTFWTCIMRAI